MSYKDSDTFLMIFVLIYFLVFEISAITMIIYTYLSLHKLSYLDIVIMI